MHMSPGLEILLSVLDLPSDTKRVYRAGHDEARHQPFRSVPNTCQPRFGAVTRKPSPAKLAARQRHKAQRIARRATRKSGS